MECISFGAGAPLTMRLDIRLSFPVLEQEVRCIRELIMRTKQELDEKLDQIDQAILAETEQGKQIKAGLDEATAALATMQTKVDELTTALEQAGQPVPEV